MKFLRSAKHVWKVQNRGKIHFVSLLPNVLQPVPFYSQSFKVCFVWLLRVWSLVSRLLEDHICIDKIHTCCWLAAMSTNWRKSSDFNISCGTLRRPFCPFQYHWTLSWSQKYPSGYTNDNLIKSRFIRFDMNFCLNPLFETFDKTLGRRKFKSQKWNKNLIKRHIFSLLDIKTSLLSVGRISEKCYFENLQIWAVALENLQLGLTS